MWVRQQCLHRGGLRLHLVFSPSSGWGSSSLSLRVPHRPSADPPWMKTGLYRLAAPHSSGSWRACAESSSEWDGRTAIGPPPDRVLKCDCPVHRSDWATQTLMRRRGWRWQSDGSANRQTEVCLDSAFDLGSTVVIKKRPSISQWPRVMLLYGQPDKSPSSLPALRMEVPRRSTCIRLRIARIARSRTRGDFGHGGCFLDRPC